MDFYTRALANRVTHQSLALVVIAALALIGCTIPGPQAGSTLTAVPVATATPTIATGPGVITGTAVVERVEVRILESMPVQVQAVASGYLPEECMSIGEITTMRKGNTFVVTIPSLRPAEVGCAEVIEPFEQVIPLDVAGLLAGKYTVTVNGVSATFELSVDNVLPTPSG